MHLHSYNDRKRYLPESPFGGIEVMDALQNNKLESRMNMLEIGERRAI